MKPSLKPGESARLGKIFERGAGFGSVVSGGTCGSRELQPEAENRTERETNTRLNERKNNREKERERERGGGSSEKEEGEGEGEGGKSGSRENYRADYYYTIRP